MPIPNVTGAWLAGEDPGARQFINIGDLAIESGEVIPNVVIAYQSYGKLNPTKDNAILVNHAWTGWSDVEGWWPNQVGPGKPLDTDKYFVVCPNVIGGCQGSTGPASKHPDGKLYGSRFPSLTIRDMVAAEVAFTNVLGIKKYVLSCGPSLGGMRSLEWAVAALPFWSALPIAGKATLGRIRIFIAPKKRLMSGNPKNQLRNLCRKFWRRVCLLNQRWMQRNKLQLMQLLLQ